jgi:hypothetical protein
MSAYILMWEKIRELTPAGRERWINVLTPCTGQQVDFRGVQVLDVDVVEALRNAK